MNITILSLFPDILRGFFESSIMAKAVERGIIAYRLVDIREYATDKHRKCDDEVFGGGAGMLMMPGPLEGALVGAGCHCRDRAGSRTKRTVYMTPSGRLLNQALAEELSREEELVVVCGRYEGIDQRIIDRYVTDEVSIGDYVLSSGEIAALVLVDAVYRLIPGVISGESLAEESFGRAQGGSSGSLLEYPQYTRPAVYDSMRVPEVLTSGHHAKIERWRLRERIRKTLAYRPELLAGNALTDEVRALLREILSEGSEHEPHAENSSPTD